MLNCRQKSIESYWYSFQLAYGFFNHSSLMFKKYNYFAVIKHFKVGFKSLDPESDFGFGSKKPLNPDPKH